MTAHKVCLVPLRFVVHSSSGPSVPDTAGSDRGRGPGRRRDPRLYEPNAQRAESDRVGVAQLSPARSKSRAQEEQNRARNAGEPPYSHVLRLFSVTDGTPLTK
jgi:hypothetical protein